MYEVSSSVKNEVLTRISGIVDNLIQSESIYQQIDKARLMQIFSKLLNKVTPEEVISEADDELTKRVEGVMAIELLYGMLDHLTPEEMETFDAAVEGR